MSTNQSQAHISREKIMRYLRDELPGTESRALELHLADCSFCSDAAEGLESLPLDKTATILDDLDQKIARRSQKRAVPLFRYTAGAAAVILVLISAVWALKTSDADTAMAENAFEKTAPQEEEQRFDNHKSDLSEADEAGLEEAESNLPLNRGETETAEEEDEVKLLKKGNFLTKTNSENFAETLPKEEKRGREQAFATETTADPRPEAADKVAGAEVETENYALADDIIEEEPSPLILAAGGEKKDEQPLRKEKAKNSNRLSSFSGVQQTADTLYTESALPALKNDNFRPIGGQSQFLEYVQKNTDLPADSQAISGETELEFSLRNGRPVRIKITEKLRPDCDKEAVRLLKNGPKWEKTGSGKRQKVRIPFSIR